MLLEFSIENYRSIRARQTLSMIADESKSQDPDGPLIAGPNGTPVLPVAMIYGANASGKSNLMRAFGVLRKLVESSSNNHPTDLLEGIEPFLFHPRSTHAPTKFEVDFLAENIRYKYNLSADSRYIEREALRYYPKGRETLLFERVDQSFKFGGSLRGRKNVVADLTTPNQLFLGKATQNSISQLDPVYQFFSKGIMPIPFLDKWVDNYYLTTIAKYLHRDGRETEFAKRFQNLIKVFDTSIDTFEIHNDKNLLDTDYRILINHRIVDDGNNPVGSSIRPLEEESTGTQKLFVLGGLLLRAILFGRTIVIDEFERSLHPFISSFLIQIFQNAQINQKSAQLILATHDTHLLNSPNLRRDQIWLIEKDQTGSSTLFSLADIKGLRADIPLEKWYLSGRLGGVPVIESLDFELGKHEPT